MHLYGVNQPLWDKEGPESLHTQLKSVNKKVSLKLRTYCTDQWLTQYKTLLVQWYKSPKMPPLGIAGECIYYYPRPR